MRHRSTGLSQLLPRLVTDLKDIIKEIENGMPQSSVQRTEARENLDYAELRFQKYPVKNRDGRFQSDMPPRYSPIMKRIVEILCGFLYKTQPTRKLRDGVASE